MAQKPLRAKMPDGSIQTFPTLEEAKAAAAAMLAAQDTAPATPATIPEPPTGNILQRGLSAVSSAIRNAPDVLAVPSMPLPLQSFVRGQAADVVDALAHPIDNAPTLGAMALSAAVPALAPARPVLGRVLGAVAGGAGGALLRGDETVPALTRGAIEGAAEGVAAGIGRIPAAAGSLSRHATLRALSPSDDIINAVRNPATGRTFPIPGQAEARFGERALELGQGTPSSVKFAQSLIDDNAADRATKQALLKADPNVVVDVAELTPVGLFDDIVAQWTQRKSGKEAKAAEKSLMTVIGDHLQRASPVAGALRANTNLPVVGAPKAKTTWTLPELDEMLKGIDKQLELQNAFRDAARATSGGKPIPDTAEEEILKRWRRHLSDLLESKTPGLAEVNARISERIPYERAAREATRTGGEIPNVRLAASGIATPPKVSFYEYGKKRTFGAVARPARAIANRTLPSPPVVTQTGRALLLPSHERGGGR